MTALRYHHDRQVAASTVLVVRSPTFQLSNFPTFRLLDLLALWLMLVGISLLLGAWKRGGEREEREWVVASAGQGEEAVLQGGDCRVL